MTAVETVDIYGLNDPKIKSVSDYQNSEEININDLKSSVYLLQVNSGFL